MIVADKLTEDVRQFSRAWMRAFGNQGPGLAKGAGGISVLEDNGFLPEGITSPYEYFLARENGGIPEERELFFNFIQVPEYWEIRTGNRGGGIYDMGRKKADIYITVKENWCVRNITQILCPTLCYVTDVSETCSCPRLTRRTFYNRDGGAVYDQIFEGETEWYIFPDGRLCSGFGTGDPENF